MSFKTRYCDLVEVQSVFIKKQQNKNKKKQIRAELGSFKTQYCTNTLARKNFFDKLQGLVNLFIKDSQEIKKIYVLF